MGVPGHVPGYPQGAPIRGLNDNLDILGHRADKLPPPVPVGFLIPGKRRLSAWPHNRKFRPLWAELVCLRYGWVRFLQSYKVIGLPGRQSWVGITTAGLRLEASTGILWRLWATDELRLLPSPARR